MSRQFKLTFMDRVLKFNGHSGPLSYEQYKIDYQEAENGSISGNKEWAAPNEVVTLTDTPDETYTLDEYYVNGSALSGNKFLMPNEDVKVSARFKEAGYPITYLTDGHGTLTGPEIGIPGQGVELSAQYNDYYRLNNYEVSGGTINGNVLTPTGPCTVKANFKLNSFTASGGFEKGSDVSKKQSSNFNVGPFYCTRSYSTDNVPSSWYSTSNRWKPTGEISGYSMTINGKMGMKTNNTNRGETGWYSTYTACILVGSTKNQVQGITMNTANTNFTYSKSVTTSTKNVNYGVSGVARCGAYNIQWGSPNYFQVTYVASLTNGTWKATGVIK